MAFTESMLVITSSLNSAEDTQPIRVDYGITDLGKGGQALRRVSHRTVAKTSPQPRGSEESRPKAPARASALGRTPARAAERSPPPGSQEKFYYYYFSDRKEQKAWEGGGNEIEVEGRRDPTHSSPSSLSCSRPEGALDARRGEEGEILDPRPRAAVLRSKAHPAAKASGESCGRLAGPRPRGPAILPPNGTARRPPAPRSAPPRAQAARRLPAAPARAPASRNPLPWGAPSARPPRTERPSRNLSQGTVDDERRRKSRLNGRVGEQREMGSGPPPATFQTFGGGVRRKGASRPGRGVAPPPPPAPRRQCPRRRGADSFPAPRESPGLAVETEPEKTGKRRENCSAKRG
ncbi:uncharacterized protein LOC128059187 [Budorcas taxicolor]|uniref:uncharacterized protein LOC128059187 n=1 Tax=Budorcas taxicolor TaxID=37181 RepID=UPI00228454D3|nr:uncharacterized protein LOC128059187 [Budorcas taxicolor]